MKEDKPPLIEIDWNQISTVDEFYDTVLPQSEAPSWHGRNLNALNDSWVTGGINRGGPPYNFRIQKKNYRKGRNERNRNCGRRNSQRIS
ncbi:barstar family protein [Pelagicoccus sp. NFK12]|uniref:Barstar family protein n=1 Tax=Pelagicoccus enzymogenes TaxID=2773457 RepID=A0A927F720_9BACT|nr:barstar family protein [Pelagicoccus enzymogenes]